VPSAGLRAASAPSDTCLGASVLWKRRIAAARRSCAVSGDADSVPEDRPLLRV
jgi:hypothetical protein